jgi:hypothetical protein
MGRETGRTVTTATYYIDKNVCKFRKPMEQQSSS